MRDRDPRDDVRLGVGRYRLSTQNTNAYNSAQYNVRDKLLLAVTYVVRVQSTSTLVSVIWSTSCEFCVVESTIRTAGCDRQDQVVALQPRAVGSRSEQNRRSVQRVR